MKTMNGKLLKGLAASAALVLSSLGVQGTAAAEAGMKDSGISYRETVETIQNPAAGYTSTVWAYCSPGKTNVYSPTGSFVLFFIDIGGFSCGANGTSSDDGTYTEGKDYPLDDTFFSAWRQTLENCRRNGCMVGMRFRYDANGKENPEPASFDMVLSHIDQIKKSGILSDYSDIITLVESGFVGKWGEQHGGKYTSLEYKAKLLDALLDAVPDNIPVTVRTPDTFAEWAGIKRSQLTDADLYEKARLSSDFADQRILSRRVGMYNDGYMGSDSDLGTFADRKKETDWLSSVTPETYYGGEFSGNIDFARKYDTYLPENAIPEMYKTHLSYINGNIFGLYKDYTFNSALDTVDADNSAYYGQNVFTFIRDHLGYRFVLRKSELSDSVQQGGLLKLKFSVENTGFSAPVPHTQGYIILERDGVYIKVPVDLDCHSWDSCTVTDSELTVKLPDNIRTGKWNVCLKETMGGYSDEFTELPLRSIRFANNNVWKSELGANYLGSVDITASDSKGADNSMYGITQQGRGLSSDEFLCSESRTVVDGIMTYNSEWTDDMLLAKNENGTSLSVRADEKYLYVMSSMPEGSSAPVYNIQLNVPKNDNEYFWLYYASNGFVYFNHDNRDGCDCKWKGDMVEFRLPFDVFGISAGDEIKNLRVFLQDSGNDWKLMGDAKAAELTVPADMTVYTAEKDIVLAEGESSTLRVRTPVENVSYQWMKDGTALKNGSGDTYTINKASASDKGVYTVKLTSAEGIVKEVTAANVLDVISGGLTGDTNGDGAITSADLVLLSRWLMNAKDAKTPQNSDIIPDGRINVHDLTALRKLVIS